MKVLIIPTWYPSGVDKLMGIYHQEFTEALNNNGIEANILFIERQRLKNVFKYLFMQKKEVIEETNYKTYIYRMLNYEPINFDLQMKKYTKKMEKAFEDYLKYNPKPDVIHAHVTVPAGYAACKIGEKYNIPVVVSEHTSYFKRFFETDPWQKYGKYTLKNVTFTCVSDFMKDYILKYKTECYTLPNSVNTKVFNNKVKRKITKEFRLVSASALRKGKNLDVAFKALKLIKEQGTLVHLDVIGDGYLEDYYKKEASNIGVDDIVTFLGRKNKKEMAEIFKKEHALIISSEYETFAIPGIEALASGMPVISTDSLGPRMYINEKTGVLCKVNDEHDLSRAILEVYNNYDKYDPLVLKEMADNFSEEEVAKKAKKIYDTAIIKEKR